MNNKDKDKITNTATVIMPFTISLTVSDLLLQFLIFCRVAPIIISIPGMHFNAISQRIKLLFAISFSIFISSCISLSDFRWSEISSNIISKNGELHSLNMAMAIASEILVGSIIGTIIMAHASVVSTCGTLIGLGSGLTNVATGDSLSPMENTTIAQFLSLCFAVLVFISDIHLFILQLIKNSYQKIDICMFYEQSGSLIMATTRVVANSVVTGVQISMPITIASILFAITIGVISRVAPNLNIYYMLMPVQFLIGVGALYFCISEILTYALEKLIDGLNFLEFG